MSNAFLTELHVKPIKGHPHWWEVTAPLKYRYEETIITVPEGFRTDFASVPRFLWAILPPTGVYVESAVVHDYLYYTGKYTIINHKISTRKVSDAVFLAAMETQGVSTGIAKFMYYGVRMFGGIRAKLLNETSF